MPHSYASIFTHIVYSTKDRTPQIDAALEERLFPYLAGIVKQLGGKACIINGVSDHVHLLTETRPTIALAELIAKVKGSSSKWIHETFPEHARFHWQRGYGAFSVSRSNIPAVARYIEQQKIHHRKVTFTEERKLRRHRNPGGGASRCGKAYAPTSTCSTPPRAAFGVNTRINV